MTSDSAMNEEVYRAELLGCVYMLHGMLSHMTNSSTIYKELYSA